MSVRTHLILIISAYILSHTTITRAQEKSLELTVKADQPWVQTAIEVKEGEQLLIEALGYIEALRPTTKERLFGFHFDRRVPPEGTYRWPSDYLTRRRLSAKAEFPLAAGFDGPNPAFCLIAKIGDSGVPFYAGKSFKGVSDSSGVLWLGINDYDFRGNKGSFDVSVEIGRNIDPDDFGQRVIYPEDSAPSVSNAKVILLYVDGLRPDVLHDMAKRGLMPNTKKVFIDEGVEFANVFTTFPSNTLNANGALFTGLFSNRNGIKSQNQFERTTRKYYGRLDEWLPDWWVTRKNIKPQVYNLLDKFAPESTYQFLRKRNVPTLGSRLGNSYRFTILPISPMNPPFRWLHSAWNVIDNPFAASSQVPHELDRIDAHFVTHELMGGSDVRVISAWFPMNDKVSHSYARGQFGGSRREIAWFDVFLGDILKRLKQLRWDKSTYLFLVSDHGHLGGEETVNRKANIPLELFHERLGCDARVVGQEWHHPGNDPDHFVFVDNQGAGQAGIFLPKGSYHTGRWAPNSLRDLTDYDFGPNFGRVNLLEALSNFSGSEWSVGLNKPVDLVLVRLDARKILVYRSLDNQAMIEIVLGPDGSDWYRYRPIRDMRQNKEGVFEFSASFAGSDPLGFLSDAGIKKYLGSKTTIEDFLSKAHSAKEWLGISAEGEYPDSVVGIATFFDWKPPMDDLAFARTPDIVVTASRGWSFRSDDDLGTDHGYPLRESMRMIFFIAGPNLKQEIVKEPHRIVDVVPTILNILKYPYRPEEMDGKAISWIYQKSEND